MSAGPVAIIDIGSNSIKLLVARNDPVGRVQALAIKTLDARISAGISQANPRLTAESIALGIDAIRELLSAATPYSPERTLLVATSAVRGAANAADFRGRVRDATGQEVRILTGDEEANLIGRGLTCDPALAALRDFYVFDLGGGSLECLSFRDRRIEKTVSLPLGCVRLTEQFVTETENPLPAAVTTAISRHVRTTLAQTDFPFSLPSTAPAVGTGGTVTTLRAILAARSHQPLEATDTLVPVPRIRALLAELSALPLADRQRVPGLPAARADVFPTALATLEAVADAGAFTAFQHSFFNLRFGLAAEALGCE